MNKKKVFLILGVSVMLLSFVMAYYFFFVVSTAGYVVRGGTGNPLVVTADLSDQLFLVNETNEIIQTLAISNADGQQNMTLEMNVSYTPIDLDCPDGENDVQFVFQNHLGEIKSGETFLLNGVMASFDLVASVDPAIQDRVCDGDYEVTIQMTETPQ